MSDLSSRAHRALAELVTDRTISLALVAVNEDGDLELVHFDCSEADASSMLRQASEMATDPACEIVHERATVM